ncbi:site-specific integrase [Vibrio lentus]|uniref:site-specific integrase n=1 Tax=Vibrio lentus TaxID=136468 RepID=UPI00178CDC68|nr:site-specific integrase [Vibrio lentus]MDN3629777.1 site-specific integrase [Vibrio lentus]
MQRVRDKTHNKHWIYLDDNDVPLLLPCLYSRYTTLNGLSVVHEKVKNAETEQYDFQFKEVEIGEDAQNVRGEKLGVFLEWLEDYAKESDQPLLTLDNHIALPDEYMNTFINDHLVHKMEVSEVVVNRAVMSLESYYNWLSYFFDMSYKKIFIYSENRQLVRLNSKSKLIIKYLLPATRELLYANTNTFLEEIVLRNGGELGCRTKENQGFYLEDFKADGFIQKGLLNLFKDIMANPDKEEFEYHLASFHAKYGSKRKFYIQRSHLSLMKRYYDQERPKTESNQLLVSNSTNDTFGKPVGKQYGTQLFSRVLEKVRKLIQENPEAYSGYQELDKALSYHHLRHSFGTDIFYEGCQQAKKSYESITTESAVYIETARRLGHKVDSKYSNQTTKMYIHACGQREQLLREVVLG